MNQETGASAWLTKQQGYALTEQLFWDLIHIQYRWQLSRTSEFCEYGIRFLLQHALSCKRGEFASIRHNNIYDITAKKLCKEFLDVWLEPPLQPLNGEELCERSTITTNEARFDVNARGFCLLVKWNF